MDQRSLSVLSWCCTSRMSRRFHSPVHVVFSVTHTRDDRLLSPARASISISVSDRSGLCVRELDCECECVGGA